MEKLEKVFNDVFETDATGNYFAPGRINLIGEHTDYNGGHVFPASIMPPRAGWRGDQREDEARYLHLCIYEGRQSGSLRP